MSIKQHNVILKSSDWQSLNVRLLLIYDGQVAPNSSCQDIRTSELYSLWLLKEGSVSMKLTNGSRRTAKAGSWVMATPGTKRSQQFSAGSRILSTAFSIGWPGVRNLFYLEEPLISPPERGGVLNNAAFALVEYVSMNISPVYTQQQNAEFNFSVHAKNQILFWEFLNAWYGFMIDNDCKPQLKNDIEPRLKLTLPILQQHHFNHPLPYNRLCRHTGLSRSHFDRLFKQEFKTSPKKFCEQTCMENAVRQLTSNTLSVKEIAYELGFVNVSHFCTWFKRKTHKTPEEYRHSFV